MRNFLSLALQIIIVGLSALQCVAQTPAQSGQGQPPVLKGDKKVDKDGAASKTDAGAQGEVGEDEVVRVDTSLVTIPVSVVDSSGKYVTDLTKEDFRIYEDGAEQQLSVFSQVTQPIFVVLLIDASGSVQGSLNDIKEAAKAFVEQLQPNDYVFPVIFSGSIIPMLPQATNDKAELRQAIQRIEPIPEDASSIYDAVQVISDRILKRAKGRKALILFTDGEDVSSRKATPKSSLRDAQELDALIYTVQYPRVFTMKQENSVNAPRTYDELGAYLKKLAEVTGGRYYTGDSSRKIKQAFASITEELRRQYILGYYPDRSAGKGRGRRLKVVVNRQNMNARTRKTFIDIR